MQWTHHISAQCLFRGTKNCMSNYFVTLISINDGQSMLKQHMFKNVNKWLNWPCHQTSWACLQWWVQTAAGSLSSLWTWRAGPAASSPHPPCASASPSERDREDSEDTLHMVSHEVSLFVRVCVRVFLLLIILLSNTGRGTLPKFWNGGRWDWTTVPSIDSPVLYHATTAPH